MKVTWSRRALDVAAETVSRIVEDGRPQAAVSWLDGLERRVELLRDAPLQGRIVPEWVDSSLRELIYGRYRVIYQPGDAEVVIVTIFHSRQTLPESQPEDSV